MKILLTLLLCLPLIAFSQGNVYLKTTPSKSPKPAQSDSIDQMVTRFVIQDRVVSYENVYEVPGTSQQEIREKLIQKLSSDSRISLDLSNSSGELLITKLKGFKIDYRKYDFRTYHLMNNFTDPIYADAVIQIREGRYRLILKDMYVLTSDSSKFVFNRDFNIRQDKIRVLSQKHLENTFYAFGKGIDELFDLRNATLADW